MRSNQAQLAEEEGCERTPEGTDRGPLCLRAIHGVAPAKKGKRNKVKAPADVW